MKCRKLRRKLVPFLDGELPAGRATCFREHLASCQTCRAEAELLGSTLDVAVHRAHETAPPAVPQDFMSRFWEMEQRQPAAASREARRSVPRKGVWSSVRGIPRRYTIAGVSATFIVAFAIVALLRDRDVQPGSRTAKPSERTGVQLPTVTDADRLAEIEKRLAELEAAVRRVRSLGDTHVSYTGEEMREIYAAIGLAAANNYRNVLNMNDVAAKKYTHVASTFPETSAGQEATRILSRLN